MRIAGAVFTIIGALDAFPRRLAAREIAARDGTLRRGLSRRTDALVIGHRAIESWTPDRILSRLTAADSVGVQPISEYAFLYLLGLKRDGDAHHQLSRQAMIEQSGLAGETLDILTLFDAFEVSEPPFGFRDLVAAKQFARLVGDGAEWATIVCAVQSARHTPAAASISSLRLECSAWKHVVARHEDVLAELNGQQILSLDHAHEECIDMLFEEAEEAEDDQDWDRAAGLYKRCLAINPHDPVIPYNLSHVLIEKGVWKEARHYLNRVLKLDPVFAEAWYNLAILARDENDTAAAKRYLQKAIAADAMYPDPVYNLALIEFEDGAHVEASRLWTKYLELDPSSDWGRRAKHGLRLIDMMAASREPKPEEAPIMGFVHPSRR